MGSDLPVQVGDLIELSAPSRLHDTYENLVDFPMLYHDLTTAIWYDHTIVGIVIEMRQMESILNGPEMAYRVVTSIGHGWTSLEAIQSIPACSNRLDNAG